MKLKGILNIGPEQADNCHGEHKKDLFVLHETVSPDYPGWADVRQTSEYLDNKNYGIHGVVDLEGNKAWARQKGECVFWHTASGTGGVNTRGVGCELVSRVMLQYKTRAAMIKAWLGRDKQLNEAAKLCAAVCRAHGIPREDSDGSKPGITTHWEVTKRFGVYGGHVDCWPSHLGGYFPKRLFIRLVKRYYALGYEL